MEETQNSQNDTKMNKPGAHILSDIKTFYKDTVNKTVILA